MKVVVAKPLPVYPAPVFLVGVYDEESRPSGMIAAWGGVCCSEPPCISIAVQRSRHSFGGIEARKAFTVNIPSEAQAAQADYFGIFSGRDRDKFAAAGLTPKRGELVDAPLVEEFPISFECEVVHSAELGSHVLFVGKVVRTWALEECLNDKGQPDPLKVRPLVFAPQYGLYYGLGDKPVADAFSVGKSIEKD
ncbi:MAG: flavin reductase family protein [Synergistota bacterium]|nr:flavin reductase family protein [Synergistota bacterium]